MARRTLALIACTLLALTASPVLASAHTTGDPTVALVDDGKVQVVEGAVGVDFVDVIGRYTSTGHDRLVVINHEEQFVAFEIKVRYGQGQPELVLEVLPRWDDDDVVVP